MTGILLTFHAGRRARSSTLREKPGSEILTTGERRDASGKRSGVKLIAVLRDPVERALSHYHNDRRVGTESRTLEQAIDADARASYGPEDQFYKTEELLNLGSVAKRSYLDLGLYATHLERWLTVFLPEELLIVISEELKFDHKAQMQRVFKHLGSENEAPAGGGNEHTGTYDQPPSDIIRTKLATFYERHNERLYELLARRLNGQSSGL